MSRVLLSINAQRFTKFPVLVLLVVMCWSVQAWGQPASLSFSPGITIPGEGYTISVGNGANMTVDVLYTFNYIEPPQQVDAWQTLDGNGQKFVSLPPDTALGPYVIKMIRENGTTEWIDIADATVVVQKQPTTVSVPDWIYLGDYYNITVNAVLIYIDLKYKLNNAPGTRSNVWIGPFGYDGGTYPASTGAYTFEEVKNSAAINWYDSNDDTILVIDPPPPDFFLTVNPVSREIPQGQSAVYSVWGGALYGFNSAVTMQVSGLPSGASGSFSPAVITPTQETTLTINTVGMPPPGSYVFTITGTSGTLVRTITATLIVTPGPSTLVKEYVYLGGRLIAVEGP